MSLHTPKPLKIDGGDLYVGIVAARFNGELVDALVKRAQTVLAKAGVPSGNIRVERVPGANELPYLANMMAASRQYDAIIALGVVIAGSTVHDEVIAHGTATAMHMIGVQTECPIINGILTVENDEQAEERVNGKLDRGAEFANAALEMAVQKLKYTRLLDELDAEAAQRDDFDNLFHSN